MTELTFGLDDFEKQLERFDQAWQETTAPAIDDFLPRHDAQTELGFGRKELLVELIMIDLECRWRRQPPQAVSTVFVAHDQTIENALSEKPLLEDYLRRYPELGSSDQLPVELVAQEYQVRHRWGDRPGHETYIRRFPHLSDSLSSALEEVDRQRPQMFEPAETEDSDVRLAQEADHQAIAETGQSGIPPRIGRYRVRRVLGKGSFGLVYEAYDDQLDRSVAVKVPHASLVASPKDAAPYLAEAQTVAMLDHPNIVPVYDVGSTKDFPCFVVSKLVDGVDLATHIKDGRPRYVEATEIVATVADALQYAHEQGIVHRDVKPSNILIDAAGEPFLVDFGLALREQDEHHGAEYAGTPAYMSPEQAGGEVNQIDARSDVFSLGVVLYQLLAGQQPFTAETPSKLVEQITDHEPPALHQHDDTVLEQLQPICSKAMSKHGSDRYGTAGEFADDLRHFLSQTIADEPAQLLLVDDNTTNLQVLSQILAGLGHRMLVAKSGENALSIARKMHPDLILLDIMMPGIDGFETCRQLKEDPTTRQSVVIFLSARGDVSDKVRGLELGAADYIAKPFDAEEVIARVRTHLKNRQMRKPSSLLPQRRIDK